MAVERPRWAISRAGGVASSGPGWAGPNAPGRRSMSSGSDCTCAWQNASISPGSSVQGVCGGERLARLIDQVGVVREFVEELVDGAGGEPASARDRLDGDPAGDPRRQRLLGLSQSRPDDPPDPVTGRRLGFRPIWVTDPAPLDTFTILPWPLRRSSAWLVRQAPIRFTTSSMMA